ncbi:peptidase [Paenibacillus sp. Cedars]|nr:DUF1796 family putative cysteine peptidase [Paenibacillus sp. Cedars]AWP27926.1 peptidase [Paenibacillus sp. Cedars]
MVTNLKLQDVKGAYDVIIGLGSWCGPSLYLRQRGLRRFAFPLDWMISNSISDVSRLLDNRFVGFMDLEQLQKTKGTSALLEDGVAVLSEGNQVYQDAHFILDTRYNIISVHDFPVLPNQDWMHSYDVYRGRLNHRIDRFFRILEHSESVLFVRWGEVTADEAAELHAVLSSLVRGTCNVLFLQTLLDLENVQEIDWGMNGICTLQVPDSRPNDISIWNYALDGLRLTNRWGM